MLVRNTLYLCVSTNDPAHINSELATQTVKTLSIPQLVNCKFYPVGVFVSSLVREQLREQTKQYEKSENDLKALQSVGQVRFCIALYSCVS